MDKRAERFKNDLENGVGDEVMNEREKMLIEKRGRGGRGMRRPRKNSESLREGGRFRKGRGGRGRGMGRGMGRRMGRGMGDGMGRGMGRRGGLGRRRGMGRGNRNLNNDFNGNNGNDINNTNEIGRRKRRFRLGRNHKQLVLLD